MNNKICPRCHEGEVTQMSEEQTQELIKRLNAKESNFKKPIFGCSKCQYWEDQFYS